MVDVLLTRTVFVRSFVSTFTRFAIITGECVCMCIITRQRPMYQRHFLGVNLRLVAIIFFDAVIFHANDTQLFKMFEDLMAMPTIARQPTTDAGITIKRMSKRERG